MAIQITCQYCHASQRCSDPIDIGILWHPQWAVLCGNCNSVNIFDEGLQINILKTLFREDDDIPALRNERWLQNYFLESYQNYGFSNIKGPFIFGPDFNGVYAGKKRDIEVEWNCFNYIKHNHHNNPKFKNVEILVVLDPFEPDKNIKKLIPQTIINIDKNDYEQWFNPKAEKYKKSFLNNKISSKFLGLIVGEFKKRFIQFCPDQDRESAMCPDCEICPYHQDEVHFDAWAITFIESHFSKIKVLEDHETDPLPAIEMLSLIEPQDINAFIKLIL